MEKEQLRQIKTLAPLWKAMAMDLAEKEEFSAEQFCKTFAGTYELLTPYSVMLMVDKDIMQLIVQVQSFISARTRPISGEHAAAVVMAERLLHHCVVRPAAYVEPVLQAPIYSIESHEELLIDFSNVEGSMQLLQEAYAKGR